MHAPDCSRSKKISKKRRHTDVQRSAVQGVDDENNNRADAWWSRRYGEEIRWLPERRAAALGGPKAGGAACEAVVAARHHRRGSRRAEQTHTRTVTLRATRMRGVQQSMPNAVGASWNALVEW